MRIGALGSLERNELLSCGCAQNFAQSDFDVMWLFHMESEGSMLVFRFQCWNRSGIISIIPGCVEIRGSMIYSRDHDKCFIM